MHSLATDLRPRREHVILREAGAMVGGVPRVMGPGGAGFLVPPGSPDHLVKPMHFAEVRQPATADERRRLCLRRP